jgi:hypothetical protein
MSLNYRRRKEEGRRKREEGRRKKEEGRKLMVSVIKKVLTVEVAVGTRQCRPYAYPIAIDFYAETRFLF